MASTRLAGHGLQSGGAAFIPASHGGRGDVICGDRKFTRCRGHIGCGLCQCGERSPVLWSDNARKRWHREHKEKIRNGG
jgi:hypothetical protein